MLETDDGIPSHTLHVNPALTAQRAMEAVNTGIIPGVEMYSNCNSLRYIVSQTAVAGGQRGVQWGF